MATNLYFYRALSVHIFLLRNGCGGIFTYYPFVPIMHLSLAAGQKAYFVSDAHFGLPSHAESLVREKLLVKWLHETAPTAAAYFLLGDIFDFWWEYRRVVPAGYTRLLGTLGQLADAGIPVHIFWGNHDMWGRHQYLQHELGATLHTDELRLTIAHKRFYLHHGDGLGEPGIGYPLMKWGFRNKWLQWAYSQLHPDLGQWIGQRWSHSRKYDQRQGNVFWGEGEFLFQHAQRIQPTLDVHYVVNGHRHTPVIMPLGPDSYYVNTGDWFQYFSFGEFDGQEFRLLHYPGREDYSQFSFQHFPQGKK